MIPQNQITSTLKRLNERKPIRDRNEKMIDEKRFFDIDKPSRVKEFLERRKFSAIDTREIMKSTSGIPELVETITTPQPTMAKSLERILGTNDLVDISFLLRGISAARSTGRVWINDSNNRLRGYGTGFLVSPSLMITNHHVLPDANTATFAVIEMDYQFDQNNQLLQSQLFKLDPNSFY